jgi:hypothetical protein
MGYVLEQRPGAAASEAAIAARPDAVVSEGQP